MTGRSDGPRRLGAALVFSALAACPSGQPPAACLVERDADGTVRVSCPDGTNVSFHDRACTVRQNCDGTATVSCPDGTSATWYTGSYCALAAGADATCGIGRGRGLRCWGGPFRDMGGGFVLPAGRYLQVDGLAEGLDFLALREDGAPVWVSPYCQWCPCGPACWPVGGEYSRVSSGDDFGCGVTREGEVRCWGSNDYGATDAPAGSFLDVSCGVGAACAITSDREVVCWGEGLFTPPPVLPPGEYSSISVGSRHGCAVRSEGSLECWGEDSFGQATPPPGSFTEVAVGFFHSCGLRDDGTIACWGAGVSGDSDCRTFYQCGQSRPPEGRFLHLTAGDAHNCAVAEENGKTVCWGSNIYGQLDVPSDFP